jgi:RNA polymerase sigma-70 factor (ECF subfamily)
VAASENVLLDSVPGPVASDPEETRTLLARARGGDRTAANEVFARYEERIRRIVRVRLGPGLRRFADSGDLVQETCRAAVAGLDRLPPGRELDFVDWLSRIATNRIRDLADRVHAEKRERGREEPLASASGAGPVLVDRGSSPSEQAFRAEVRELMDELVASLPEEYREVILMRDYQGAEWAAVARALGSPTLHAAQQLHQRAWIRVRALAAPRLAQLGEGLC